VKKLAVIQTVLGILLVASFFVYVLLVEPGYSRLEIIDGEGNVVGYWGILGLRRFNPVLAAWMIAYPALGILVTGCGIANLVRVMHGSAVKELSVTQIVLGVLALALMVLFIMRVQPPWQRLPVDLGVPSLPEGAVIRYNPGWVALMTVWKIVSFMLGPVIATCGAAQLRKSRHSSKSGQ
jgi:hypothetical protein